MLKNNPDGNTEELSKTTTYGSTDLLCVLCERGPLELCQYVSSRAKVMKSVSVFLCSLIKLLALLIILGMMGTPWIT